MKKLTIKQEKFVLKYFECGNASEAYRHAYDAAKMKDETITQKASRLLNEGKVRARLKELRAKAEQEASWNVQKVLKHYTEVIEIGLGRKASKHMVTEQAGEGVSNTLEVEMCDTNLPAVNTALTNIAKHLGMFTQKVEISGEVSLKDFVKEFYEAQKEGKDG
ncbi:MAG: terminase small subunit [Sulfurimonadaceae bacterium]